METVLENTCRKTEMAGVNSGKNEQIVDKYSLDTICASWKLLKYGTDAGDERNSYIHDFDK
jgi:hypothetical protein